jgi:hypothetical protein
MFFVSEGELKLTNEKDVQAEIPPADAPAYAGASAFAAFLRSNFSVLEFLRKNFPHALFCPCH